MSSTDRVRFSGTLSALDAAQHLEDLARGLRSGAVLIEANEDAIEFPVTRDLTIALEASQPGKRKHRVDLTLMWRSEKEPARLAELRILPRDAAATRAFSSNGSAEGERAPAAQHMRRRRTKK